MMKDPGLRNAKTARGTLEKTFSEPTSENREGLYCKKFASSPDPDRGSGEET